MPDQIWLSLKNSVSLIELTIPFNSPESLANAKTQKENKENYQLVLGDLESHGYVANLITIEIGALGHWLPRTRSALLEAFPSLPKAKLTTLLDQAASTVISASHQIFKVRLDNNWCSPRPLLQLNNYLFYMCLTFFFLYAIAKLINYSFFL